MVQYPKDLPVKAMKLIIDIVLAGEIIEHKEEFAEAEWNVQGFLHRVLIGVPDDIQPVGVISKAEVADSLREMEAALRGAVNVSRGGAEWGLLVLLAQIVLELLDRCRE